MQQEKNWVILIPIWGDSHIQMCANYLLPSLLATGNLPAIQQANKPIVRFLTTKPSSNTLQNLNLFPALKDVAEINFCFIDDLVNIGNYGFTLTIAYERGIQIDAPQQQINTSYIFLNGDFVLSNNCFATLKTNLELGYTAIVCPSLRVNEQDVIAPLNNKIDAKGILDFSSRNMVRLSLDNLHPTVVGAMVNSTAIGTSISHQYFARVNNDLLIARFFLLFMFCIKPENPLPDVTSHCDYSFIPEMCPSGNYTIITDSDEAFLMELSPLEQESSYIYLGSKNLQSDAERMQQWVTKDHANYSQRTIYFHTHDLPPTNDPELIIAANNLQKVLDTLYAKLSNTPRASHQHHPFWNNYLNVLKSQGQLLERKSITKQAGLLPRIINRSTKSFLGLAPFVTPLHYKYRDYLNCLNALNTALSQNDIEKALYVCGDNKDLFKRFFEQRSNIQTDIIRIDDLVNVTNLREYDLIFIESNQAGFNKFAKYILNNRIPQDIKAIVFIDLINSAWQHNNIVPYLCLLNHRVHSDRIFTTHARQKWLYYKSSVNFMRELYGSKGILKMITFLGVFVCSAIYLAFVNKFKTKVQSTASFENLSSIVLNFK